MPWRVPHNRRFVACPRTMHTLISLPTSYFLLPTSYFLLRIASCHVGNSRDASCCVSTVFSVPAVRANEADVRNIFDKRQWQAYAHHGRRE